MKLYSLEVFPEICYCYLSPAVSCTPLFSPWCFSKNMPVTQGHPLLRMEITVCSGPSGKKQKSMLSLSRAACLHVLTAVHATVHEPSGQR